MIGTPSAFLIHRSTAPGCPGQRLVVKSDVRSGCDQCRPHFHITFQAVYSFLLAYKA